MSRLAGSAMLDAVSLEAPWSPVETFSTLPRRRPEDVDAAADRDILLRDMKVSLAAILGVANAETLSFNWRATTAAFGETLARYQAAALVQGAFP